MIKATGLPPKLILSGFLLAAIWIIPSWIIKTIFIAALTAVLITMIFDWLAVRLPRAATYIRQKHFEGANDDKRC